ncbi:protein kinase [Streptosporangium sp. NPDC051022]|uniref:serine/threonine-protein kinase n=1 Tax=Streptosporangium sp. NPDC051022 TaxID=3155752 RepID=UPI00341A2D63
MSDSGEIIGARYRLLERIGCGGMGTVWRARDEVLGRNVAVKEVIPSPDLTGGEREVFTVRTLREARAAGRIGHPGVATVYDVIEEKGRPWIVMQLVESRTLGAVVREDGPLPPARVARIGLEVLGALVAAHHAGVLHRDVKPDNVLLARDGRAVLTDFGIAVLEGDSSVTRTGALIGTPAFIAPERASGGPAEFASDMWSLGVTLYMAVEGRSPFERAHPLATLSAVMHEEPAPLRFAGSLGPVIHGLLRKDPAHRMSAHDVQIHLRAIMNGTAPQATMPIDLPVPAPAAGPAGMPATGPIAGQAPAPAPANATVAGSGAPRAAPGPRRRPAVLAMVAAVLAVTTTAGGAAWVALSSGPPISREPSAPASVPTVDRTPGTATEQARLPADREPTPNGSGRDRREPATPPAPRDEPRTDAPSPSDRPSADPTGKDPEKDSGNGSGKKSGDRSDKGGEDGDDRGDPGKGRGDGQEGDDGSKPGKETGKDTGKDTGADDGDRDDAAQEDPPSDQIDLGDALNALAGASYGTSRHGGAGRTRGR